MRGKLVLAADWQSFVREPARSALAEQLARYAREQRWYRSKSSALAQAKLEDVFLFGEASESNHCLVLLGVELTSGERETYVMPLRFEAGTAPRIGERPTCLAELESPGLEGAPPTHGVLLDAIDSRVFAETLSELLCAGRVLLGENATLSGETFAPSAFSLSSLEPRYLALEQSNSTITYGSAWLLKLLRKLEPDPNVELEIGRFLNNAAPRVNVPRSVAALKLLRPGSVATLAVVGEYVENLGSAWSWTLASLFELFERVLTAGSSLAHVPLPSASVAECDEPVPEGLLHLAGPYFSRVRRLAERSAEMHRALGSETNEPGFGQEPFTPPEQHALYQAARGQLVRSFEALRRQGHSLLADGAELAEQVLAAESALDEQLRRITQCELTAARIRCHGDYHLGQVLFTGDDFTIIDFEGEPGRPAVERREKRSPLRDVAGMLRSFAYAAESALRSERVRAEQRARLAPWAEAFRAWVSVSFVQSYSLGVAGEAHYPETAAEARLLLEFYQLEKALYEVEYELDNRPDWVAVPLAGLARLARA